MRERAIPCVKQSGTSTPFREASTRHFRLQIGWKPWLRREVEVKVEAETRHELDEDFSPLPDDDGGYRDGSSPPGHQDPVEGRSYLGSDDDRPSP